MKDARAAFADRLRVSAREAGCEGANALMTRFNSKYSGASVSAQAVSQWLNGSSMPRHDKIVVLADVLGVDLLWLQTGKGGSGRLRQRPPFWPDLPAPEVQQMMETYLELPEKARTLVAELIAELAKATRRGR